MAASDAPLSQQHLPLTLAFLFAAGIVILLSACDRDTVNGGSGVAARPTMMATDAPTVRSPASALATQPMTPTLASPSTPAYEPIFVPPAQQDAELLSAIRAYVERKGWVYGGDCFAIVHTGRDATSTHCSLVRPQQNNTVEVWIGLVQSHGIVNVTFQRMNGGWIPIGERTPSPGGVP